MNASPTPATAATAATPATLDRYAVLGNPVAHSRSPFIHQQFAAQSGQQMVYERLLCPLDGFADAVRTFANPSTVWLSKPGGRGCNVTLPFKFEALQLAPRRTPRAQRAGAANTLCLDGSDWLADNTDGVGLLRDIELSAGCAIQQRRVLLIGAGGAAAGVLGPLLQAGPAQVVVANRSVDKARALARNHAQWALQHGVALQAGGLDEAGSGFDLVINASASSLQGAASPVAPEVFAPGALAVDLMYGAAAQPWLDWATGHGATARDGLGMLVEQAAESFSLWRGVRPDTGPVLQALRAEIAAGR
jgi:shikimate dehydrogenase